MPAIKNPTLRYTAMRLGVFAACLAVLAVVAHFGLIPVGIGDSNGLWILVLAIAVSAPLSLVLLRRQRDAMSQQIAGSVGRAKQRLDANRTMEDAD